MVNGREADLLFNCVSATVNIVEQMNLQHRPAQPYDVFTPAISLLKLYTWGITQSRNYYQ